MKTITHSLAILFGALLLVATMHLSGCGGKGPAPLTTEQKVQAKMVANNWKMQGVMVDGVDQTSVYSGLTIQFSPTGFTSTKGGVVWPAAGTWTFTGKDATAIKRNDGIEVGVEATDTSLKLTLSWSKTTIGGKVQSVQGKNVFTMAK